MNAPSVLKITLDWSMSVSDLPIERQERQTQNLYQALQQLPEVESVNRMADPNPPDGSMGAAWLRDLLLTEVIPGNIGSIFRIIQQRLPGTPMNIKIEVDGQKAVIDVEGLRPENLDMVLSKVTKVAQDLKN